MNPIPLMPGASTDQITEQNGLLYNQSGGYYCGYAPIPISDWPGPSLKRKVTGVEISRAADFHLTIRLTVEHFNPDGSHFLSGALATETDAYRRTRLHEQFRAYTVERTTRNSYIDPATGSTRTPEGEMVSPDNTEGAVAELAWLQSLDAAGLAAQLGIDASGLTYEVIQYVVTRHLVEQMDLRGQL